MTTMIDGAAAHKGLTVTLDGIAFSYGESSFRFDAEFAAGRITAIMG
ncbi:thiamine ABC transporter ATP-binding protein, partial [Mesorhizobium sp. M2C.T.Ca.TU.009.01.2.1]